MSGHFPTPARLWYISFLAFSRNDNRDARQPLLSYRRFLNWLAAFPGLSSPSAVSPPWGLHPSFSLSKLFKRCCGETTSKISSVKRCKSSPGAPNGPHDCAAST